MSVQMHLINIKLESKGSSFVSLLEALKIVREIQRQVKMSTMKIHK